MMCSCPCDRWCEDTGLLLILHLPFRMATGEEMHFWNAQIAAGILSVAKSSSSKAAGNSVAVLGLGLLPQFCLLILMRKVRPVLKRGPEGGGSGAPH